MECGEEDDAPATYLTTMEQREKEELEFYTDLAVQEMQRWIEAVTRKRFKYPEDPKSSLADGVLLCELLNGIKPHTVKRINRLPTAMAGMDNLNVFIDASKRHFGLKEAQLFLPTDLQDFAERSKNIELTPCQLKEIEDKKIRNVAITVFWLARQVQGVFPVPEIDIANFTSLVNAKTLSSTQSPSHHKHQYSSSGDWTEPDSSPYKHSRASSRDSTDHSMRRAGLDHREGRYSSSDSLDDHDRPGSQNSGTGLRRKSSSQPAVDPLQFVALKPAEHLAQKAVKQLELALETRKKRESVDKDEAEWQFMDESWKENLSSWKQRRKSKGSGVPEREANEIQTDKYNHADRSHKESQGRLSSLSYTDDEAFDSPTSVHQKPASTSSISDSNHSGNTRDFKPVSDLTSRSSVEDVVERSSVAPVQHVPSVSSTTQYSMGKSNMKIRLSANAGSEEGFGFTIKGGKDKCQPITVESVTNDSPADICELLEGDELLEINEEVVSDRNRGYCMLLINESLHKTGQLDLYIRRDHTRVSTATKERKQSSTVTPKSILDLYDRLEPPSDNFDGQMISKKQDVGKLEDEMTQRELEREYRQILDGGYDSAVSTLKSELTIDDRQSYLDSQQEKITPTSVEELQMSPPTEYISPQEYEVRETTYGEEEEQTQGENNMNGFNEVQEKVSKDFEEVAVPLISPDDVRMRKRSEIFGEDAKRMENWQQEQEMRQREQYEKEQSEIRRQMEETERVAEEQDLQRKLSSEPSDTLCDADKSLSTLANLRIGLSSAKEKQTRDKTVQKLLQIKAKFSRDEESEGIHSGTGSKEMQSREESDDDDDLAKYRIKPVEKSQVTGMKDGYTANYYNTNPKPSAALTKSTPYLSDVYKYYDEELPSNFGERDPSPPPMSRKDVMNMNKKSTPWKDTKDLPKESPGSWERKEVISSVDDDRVVPPWKRVNVNRGLAERRKSAPSKTNWRSEIEEETQAAVKSSVNQSPVIPAGDISAPPMRRAVEVNASPARDVKQSDVDPSMPSTLRKEDVLKMTREKKRFSVQPRRVSEAAVNSQPINRQNSEEPSSKPHRNSMGFFSNRAMFEQQSKEAERYWADQSKENRKSTAKPRPLAMRKVVSAVQPPHMTKDSRSKSLDFRSSPHRGDIVRSVDASDAAYERMKELAMMKTLREEETLKAEEDERERVNRERKLRDERQRELAEIRRLNQQYEAANVEERRQSYAEQSDAERADPLDRARQRMAREAEELTRAQLRHDEEVKHIHGVDMQEERRRRELERSSAVHGEDDRHSREIRDLAGDRRADVMSQQRHQEMLEQSRRDQQRREESRRVTQQSHRQPKPSQSSHHSQQQEDEWRPAYSSQSAASQLATEYSHYGKASGERSNQTAPSTNFRHDRDYSANGYGYTPDQVTTNPPHTKSHYQPPLPGHNSPLLPAGQSNIYGVSGSRGTAEPHEDSVAEREVTATGSYERQQPVGHAASHIHHDSYDRNIPPSTGHHDRIPNSHHHQNSYDKKHSSNNYIDSGDASSYSDQSAYDFSQHYSSGRPMSSYTNNNEFYKQGRYSKESSPESSIAPTKPPRNQMRPEGQDSTVSAKYSCAYCSKELGKGAAMVIESLGLYYHVECFRCCVCHSLLSNGQMGADVRVRVNRLHCKNCYSNDDAGIKYSAV